METAKAILIIMAVTSFIMFIAGAREAIYMTISAVFFLFIFSSGGSDDTNY